MPNDARPIEQAGNTWQTFGRETATTAWFCSIWRQIWSENPI